MSKTHNYMTTKDHVMYHNQDTVTLPAGSFVKPIDRKYVPPHVFEDSRNKYFDGFNHVICYTRLGMIALPREILKAV